MTKDTSNFLNLTHHYAEDAKSLCQGLFSSLDLGFFAFGRFYNGGEVSLFSTHPELYEYFFSQEYFLVAPIPAQSGENSFFYLVNTDADYEEEDNIVGEMFGLYDAINYIEIYPEYYDFYCFGHAKKQAGQLSFLVNRLPMLRRFVRKFQASQAPIIKNLKQNRSLVPDFCDSTIRAHQMQNPSGNHQYFQAELTRQEMSCLQLMCEGYTAKMIGSELRLSHRTVEKYLEYIKLKLSLRYKSELIDWYEQRF